MSQSLASERGNITLPLLILVVAFLLFVGIVVDGSGKIQAGDRANQIAQSAARVGANSLTGAAIATGSLQLDGAQAQASALSYLTAAGVNGTATVDGNTITVTVTEEYPTVFLSIIGINTLVGSGTASARLIDG
ncbi:MAG TPA: pilus assembly protein TadG-related protein [Glaciihabitans sp.]|jgi:Flp pilus assembly protein TadG|nr:pilus assembly protein TadG-related protein [Glaciihabitans sp.]